MSAHRERKEQSIQRCKVSGKQLIQKILALALISSFLFGVLPVGNIPVSKATENASKTSRDKAGHELKNPTTDRQGVTTWDCIYFGNYPQKSADSEVKERIKWRVLSVVGEDAFLLADRNIECRAFHDRDVQVTWATCTLRSWLNGYAAASNTSWLDYTEDNFLKNAFSESEQVAINSTNYTTEENDITDKIYLLSADEVKNPKYGFTKEELATTTRESKTTTYAKKRGAILSMRQNYDGNSSWWLRSSSLNYYGTDADVVTTSGCVFEGGEDVDNEHITVRPVLHLNLSFVSTWSYAGTVTSASTVKVTNLKLREKKGTLKVSWYRTSGSDGYEIWYGFSDNWKKKKIKTTTERTLILRKLKQKKIYYVRVRAYRIRGGKKVYSRWSRTCKKRV